MMNNYYASKFNSIYRVGQGIPNKIINIATYLIHNVSPETNTLYFSRKALAKRFNCNMLTVNRALKLLKSCKSLKLNNDCLQYNLDESSDKGGAKHD